MGKKVKQCLCRPSLETLINPGELGTKNGDGVPGGTGKAGNGLWKGPFQGADLALGPVASPAAVGR